jgi:hypothetical protein
LDWDYHRLAHAADRVIAKLSAPYPRAARFYADLLADEQVLALWDLTGYMAVEKLGFNDHGQMHAQIVAANAMKLLDLLTSVDVSPDVVTSSAGDAESAFVVVLAAALLHDVGNQIARERHEIYSMMLAQPVLARHLPGIYPEPSQRQVLTGFILSAIANHDCNPPPLTLEGAVVAVADAADMTQGRGQVAFDQGKADIHAVSAMAIQEVSILAGDETPVHIEVVMDNPAGLFQVEKLLARKLIVTGLDRYVGLRACVTSTERDANHELECLVLRDGRFQPETLPTPTHEHWPADPVCGMAVEPGEEAGVVVYRGVHYHLCSAACLADFRDDPLRYVRTKEKT